MISQPLTNSQIAEIPLGQAWAPIYKNRRERRKLEREKPHLKRLFKQMEESKTLEIPEERV